MIQQCMAGQDQQRAEKDESGIARCVLPVARERQLPGKAKEQQPRQGIQKRDAISVGEYGRLLHNVPIFLADLGADESRHGHRYTKRSQDGRRRACVNGAFFREPRFQAGGAGEHDHCRCEVRNRRPDRAIPRGAGATRRSEESDMVGDLACQSADGQSEHDGACLGEKTEVHFRAIVRSWSTCDEGSVVWRTKTAFFTLQNG
jgi:hypothetical protein